MQLLYLIGLLFGLAGMMTIDHRYRLAYWYDRRRTITVIATAVLVFVVWDLLGIGLGIFFAGTSRFFLPIRILPQFPVEELFFLTLLCYSTLIIYRFGDTR